MDPQRQKQLQQLLRHLGISSLGDVDLALLDQALTHPSAPSLKNYETLEFLGDAALRLAAAEYLLEAYPTAVVGELTALRSHLVSDKTLTQLADSYGLERFLWMSDAAAKDPSGRPSRLAEAFEAVLGVLYLARHDLSLIRPWLDHHFERLAKSVQADPARHNYKAALQELTQAHYKALPNYHTVELTRTHGDLERFGSEVWFQGKLWGRGKGASMKLAEQAAAREAFQAFQGLLLSGK